MWFVNLGTINIGQQLKLGPALDGNFVPVRVLCIQRCQIPVKSVKAGQTATLAIEPDSDEASYFFPGGPPHSKHTYHADVSCQSGCHHGWTRDAETEGQMLDPEHGGNGVRGVGMIDDAFPLHNNGAQIGQIAPTAIDCTLSTCESPDNMQFHPRHGHSHRSPSPTSGSTKGAVLLDVAIETTTVYEFEALMVLLGGHWPPRGLLSGQWPPVDDAFDSGSDSQSGGSYPDLRSRHVHSPHHKSKTRQKSAKYVPVIHAGSIRQAAKVIKMEEVLSDDIDSGLESLPAAFAASTAVATCSSAMEHDECGEAFGVPWCVATVHFRFMHRPEWLQQGVRFIARDATEGHLSGIGLVNRTNVDEDCSMHDCADSTSRT